MIYDYSIRGLTGSFDYTYYRLHLGLLEKLMSCRDLRPDEIGEDLSRNRRFRTDGAS